MEPIRNRVEESDLITLDLEKLWDGGEVVSFDVAPLLDRGLVLREKAFRDAISEHDWGQYRGKYVSVDVSTRAIVPKWAFMLVASKLNGLARAVHFGSAEGLRQAAFAQILASHDWAQYKDRNVVVKGCPSELVPTGAYVQAMSALQEVASKVMYGEACSAVPVWRRPQTQQAAGKAVAAKLPSRN